MAGDRTFKKNQKRQEYKSKIRCWRHQLQTIAAEMAQEVENRQQDPAFDNRDVLICEFVNTARMYAERATDELRIILGDVWVSDK